jgi:hypothetical protein
MGAAVQFFSTGNHTSKVALPASTVLETIAVEDFTPKSIEGNTDAVIMPGDRREVAYYNDPLVVHIAFSQKAQHTVSGIVTIDPLETFSPTVEPAQGRLPAIDPV